MLTRSRLALALDGLVWRIPGPMLETMMANMGTKFGGLAAGASSSPV